MCEILRSHLGRARLIEMLGLPQGLRGANDSADTCKQLRLRKTRWSSAACKPQKGFSLGGCPEARPSLRMGTWLLAFTERRVGEEPGTAQLTGRWSAQPCQPYV